MRLWYRGWQCVTRAVFCALFQVRTVGREHVPQTGPVLLVSNHQSYIDPPLCGVGLNRELDYIAREDLFHQPLFARYIRSLNAFPIQRDAADIKAIKTIINRLNDGRAIVLFPEGTRSATGRIGEIKSGIELIARRSNAVTVPVVIDGAFEAWPRQQKLPSLGRIFIYYGEPITPQQAKTMVKGEYVRLINQRLQTMQAELRIRYGRKPFDAEVAP
ncbi:MAG: 1-acyl-sn-glycerol-3-phosphate acyltransferase [Sedimentisphaerales bacterium]|nr:1-acyl-sn-glycerol-3-phosphate acyltransferase [Sedimentisphaerales bacterium]